MERDMVASKNIAFKALLILLMASCTFLQGSEKPQEESIFSRGWRSLSEMGSKIWQSPYSYYTATPLALYAAYKLAPSSYLPDKKTLGLLAIPAVAAASYYGPSNAYTAFMNKIRGQTTPTGEEEKSGYEGKSSQQSSTDDEQILQGLEKKLQNLSKMLGDDDYTKSVSKWLHDSYDESGLEGAEDFFNKEQVILKRRIDAVKKEISAYLEKIFNGTGLRWHKNKQHEINQFMQEVEHRVTNGSSSYKQENESAGKNFMPILKKIEAEKKEEMRRKEQDQPQKSAHQERKKKSGQEVFQLSGEEEDDDQTKLEKWGRELLSLQKQLNSDSSSYAGSLKYWYKQKGLTEALKIFRSNKERLSKEIEDRKKYIREMAEFLIGQEGVRDQELKFMTTKFIEEVERRVESGTSSYEKEEKNVHTDSVAFVKKLRAESNKNVELEKQERQSPMITKIDMKDTGSDKSSSNKQSSDLRRSQYDEGYETLPDDIRKEIEAVVDLKRVIEGSGKSAQIEAYKKNLITHYAQRIRDNTAKESIKQEISQLKEGLNKEIQILELKIKIARYKYQVFQLFNSLYAAGNKKYDKISKLFDQQAKNKVQATMNSWFQSMMAERKATDFKGLEPIKQGQEAASQMQYDRLKQDLSMNTGEELMLSYDALNWNLQEELSELQK